MRTTLTIEDQLASELKRISLESGKSFKDLVNEALRVGLRELNRPEPRRYSLDAVSLGKPRPGVDLVKALDLADAHSAALAIECGCPVYSADNDFKRFSGIRHINPLAD